MSTAPTKIYSASQITPEIKINDPVAAFWFGQVTLRLRREIAWCWHQRGLKPDAQPGMLPPLNDPGLESLDKIRYAKEKMHFFEHDISCQFLTESIHAPIISAQKNSLWESIASKLKLDQTAQFIMALAFAARIDAALAPLFSVCTNDLSRPFASFALAQQLWDRPLEVIHYADLDQLLFQYAILEPPLQSTQQSIWQQPLSMPGIIARQFIGNDPLLPDELMPVQHFKPREISAEADLILIQCKASPIAGIKFIPLAGPTDSAFTDQAASYSQKNNRPLVKLDTLRHSAPEKLHALACVCWIQGYDLFLSESWTEDKTPAEIQATLAPLTGIPLYVYITIRDNQALSAINNKNRLPAINIPPLSFSERVNCFSNELGQASQLILPDIEECARRYRFQERKIKRICGNFSSREIPLTANNLNKACANEAYVELGELAQRVKPRFTLQELILPEEQSRQINETLHAMRTLTVVHYHWGTASVWNESGLSVLFCGSPGTGKTMAAETIAHELDMPMYRIDLSQVVNKYIGETEKNLKRVFDIAELCDCILFFDEADALFGKRTEVKDSNDRFSNIEISYLLERMERFQGLAVLATNRRKDLDDAFIRRLRYIIEFPLPDVPERKRIWENVFPENVDVSSLDMYFLAKNFQLSGGHIRSIAFNACLQSASHKDRTRTAKVDMPATLIALKRELEKMNRSSDDGLFGRYSDLLNINLTEGHGQ